MAQSLWAVAGGGVKRVAVPGPRREPGALNPRFGSGAAVSRHGSLSLPIPRTPAPGGPTVSPAACSLGSPDWTSVPCGPG